MTINAAVREECAYDLLQPVAEHWLKARIDAPLAALERFDQNAKQMIALAAGLQVVLTAVIKLAPVDDPRLLRIAIASFSFLFLCVVFAAIVLFQHHRVLATKNVVPLLGMTRPAEIMDGLEQQVRDICEDVDGLLKWKKWFLFGSLISFSLSMLGSIACLVVMLPGGL